MRLTNAIEGGLAGATTLSLLQETLHKIHDNSPRPLFHNSGILKRIRKKNNNGKLKPDLYIKLAGELIANASFFGLTAIGKKKNAMLRGGLLGAAAGLGSAFLQTDHEEKRMQAGDLNNSQQNPNDLKSKLLTISLYTAGGILAGIAVQKLNKKRKKSK